MEERTGLTISSIGHAVVLGWGLITFAVTPLDTPRTEAMPVDLVPVSEVTELKAGQRNAKPVPEQKQLAERVAEPKPVTEPERKPTDKPERKDASAPPPPPPAAEPKPEAKPEVKPEPKPEEARAPEPPRRPPPPSKQTTTPDKAKTPTLQAKQRDFNPDKIAALLDRREPQRQVSASHNLSPAGLQGNPFGQTEKLSMSEIDALRRKLMSLWNPPAGAEKPEELIVRVRIQLGRDGKLASPPMVLSSGSSPFFLAARESAVRAIFRGQPFDMLPPDKYDLWKDIEVTFDPRDMVGG